MALPFVPSDAGLLALQAAVVAAPREVGRIRWLGRFRGPGWALVPIGSIVVVVFAIRFVSDTATGLTYLALIAVPPLAAAALAWGVRGSRGDRAWGSRGSHRDRVWGIRGGPGVRGSHTDRARIAGAVAVAAALFVVAWQWRHSLAGEAAAALLSALSCVTLGVLLSAVAPPGWLKLGILAMAAADTWLVVSDLLQSPNATLIAAHPAAGLPQLQSELFGSVSMGYGDMFVAALLGAVLARDRRLQLRAAALTFVFAALFDLLFFFVSELPATVPVALALVVVELGRARAGGRGAPRRASAPRRWSPRAAAIPRQAR